MTQQLRTFLRLKDTTRATGISRSRIYALEAQGKFPKRIPLGKRSVAWDAGEVALWQEQRLAQREFA